MRLTRLCQTSGKCEFPYGLHGSLCTLRMLRSILSYLLHIRNTRYGWVASPYPARSFTLQETPSFAWRTNAYASGAPDSRSDGGAEAIGRRLQAIVERSAPRSVLPTLSPSQS